MGHVAARLDREWASWEALLIMIAAPQEVHSRGNVLSTLAHDDVFWRQYRDRREAVVVGLGVCTCIGLLGDDFLA